MDSTATPPEAEGLAPPPPGDREAGGRWRALAVILALALAFAAAVLISLMADYADTPLCKDVRQTPLGPAEECYRDTPTHQVVVLALGWAGGILAALACISALFFAATGAAARLVGSLTLAAVLLGGASLVAGTI